MTCAWAVCDGRGDGTGLGFGQLVKENHISEAQGAIPAWTVCGWGGFVQFPHRQREGNFCGILAVGPVGVSNSLRRSRGWAPRGGGMGRGRLRSFGRSRWGSFPGARGPTGASTVRSGDVGGISHVHGRSGHVWGILLIALWFSHVWKQRRWVRDFPSVFPETLARVSGIPICSRFLAEFSFPGAKSPTGAPMVQPFDKN